MVPNVLIMTKNKKDLMKKGRFVAKGSLFLGRMSQLSDGIFSLLEATLIWAIGLLVLSNILSGTSD